MGKIIMVANEKGGTGKTMIASHLAWAADDLGLKVLAIDTDTQSAMYRRLTGEEVDSIKLKFGNSTVLYSPGEYLNDKKYELIVVDSKGSDTLAKGPVPDLVVMPINGTDALREVNNTIQAIRVVSKNVPILLVFNRLSIAGRHASSIRAIRDKKLLSNVTISEIEIGDATAIWNSEQICEAAWSMPYKNKQVDRLQQICWDILELVGLVDLEEG